jgi:hypothetical protein
LEVQDPHCQDKGDKYRADETDGQRLEEGAIETGGVLLPDDLSFRAHNAFPSSKGL